jgi:hypothetical protein
MVALGIGPQVKAKGASSLLVTALDEIAWLYNIRGGDVEFNPVTIAYSRESDRHMRSCFGIERRESSVLEGAHAAATPPYDPCRPV